MAVQIPFPLPSHGNALNSKMRVNLDFLVNKFNEFNTGTATWDTVAIGIANNETGTLTFYNSSNANYLTFQAGATSPSTTFTLPTAAPSTTPNLLYSSTGGVMKWKQVKGTTNQIIVTDNTSDVTFTTPQNLDTGASVTFNQVTATTYFSAAQLLFGNGTAANPGLTLASENTGLYRASAGVLAISVGGVSNGWFIGTGGLGYGAGAFTTLYPLELRGTGDSETIAAVTNTYVSSTTGHSTMYLAVAGTSNDPRVQYYTGSQYWTEGVDNSNSDVFEIARSNALGTSSMFRLSSAQAFFPSGASTTPGIAFLAQADLGFTRSASNEVTLYGSSGTTMFKFGLSESFVGGDLRFIGTNLLFQGTSFNTKLTGSLAATSTWTLTLPPDPGTNNYVLKTNGSGTTSWVSVSTAGGATAALDNLASVAINASLLPGTDNSIDLGNSSKNWRSLYVSTSIKNGATTLATATELGYLTGVTSAIQTQIDGKSPTAGNSSLVTVGTVTSGTWSATTVAVNKGGTGQTSYTDGQLLIGNSTGNTLAKATLTGTSNQVVVTNGSGAITLSTPQSIGTASTPTFASVSLTATTNQLVLGTTRTATITAPTPGTSSRTYTFPDMTADYSVVATEGTQTINGVKTFSNDVGIAATKGLYVDGGFNTFVAESSADVMDFTTGGVLGLRINSSQDVYTVTYTDYSSTSTVTGWSSTTQKSIYYKKIGKIVYVWFSIDGTSNATTVSFTLPYTIANTVDPGIWVAIRARDNNVDLTTPGHAEADKNSTTVNCFKDAAGGVWTNSSRKIVTGQFTYQTT